MLVARSVSMMRLAVVLVLLVIADGLISQFMTTHGMGFEGNPFLHVLITDGRFLPVKAAGALLVALVLWDIFRRQPRVALISATACVAIYTTIVYWNVAVFLCAAS